MKKRLIIFLVLIFASGLSYGMSFVYDGFECEGSQSPSAIPKQSRFEVIEELGNGAYRILFTGGLPLFSNSTGPCVGEVFGVETSSASQGKHVNKSDLQAMAYFTGSQLVISTHIMTAYGQGEITENGLFKSSMLTPQAFTWVFDFIPETTSFKMIRNFESRATFLSMGVVSSAEVIETIKSSVPTTSTPVSGVEFRLEP